MGSLNLEFVVKVALWSLPILAAVILHEVAHGFVAWRLGDDTAQRAGRLTLNPLPHIDPIGTVALPAFLLFVNAPFLFGYARPVPVNYMQLRNPRYGMVAVAAAGPLTNLVLAGVSAGAFRLGESMLAPGPQAGLPLMTAGVVGGIVLPLTYMAYYSVIINVVLAVFNLLPIPPLDGGRVLTGLLPAPQARLLARIEPFGFVILIGLLATQSLGAILSLPVQFILGVLL